MKLITGPTLNAVELIQAGLVVLCVAAAFLWPAAFRMRFFRKSGLLLRRIANRPVYALAAAGLLPVILRLLLLPIYPPPDPWAHDEYGLLLQAETFVSGRITNPPHPHWPHFESLYVLSQPTYNAKYQPGQGMVLALGLLLFGHAWAAVVLSMGVLCALLCWMLRQWMPPVWALLGALVAGLQFGVLGYWMNSYWGGTVAAIGGTMILGVLPRLLTEGGIVRASVAAIGFSIIMYTRPLEAAVLGVALSAVFLMQVFRRRKLRLWPTAVQAAAPAVLIITIAAGGLAYYNWKVTGDPLRLPYMLHIEAYGTPQGFFWQAPTEVAEFRHPEMRSEYLRQSQLHARRESLSALAVATVAKARTWWSYYSGPALTIPLLFLPFAVRNQRVVFAMKLLAVLAIVHVTYHAYYPHYTAVVTGLYFFILMQCWRHLRVWRWKGQPLGLSLSRAIPVLLCVALLIPVAGKALDPMLPEDSPEWVRDIWEMEFTGESIRSVYLKHLAQQPGRHLVFVRYGSNHHPDDEIVYNAPDLDSSQVVWAREWTEQSNAGLMRYFGDRRVWIAEPDFNPARLTEISGTCLAKKQLPPSTGKLQNTVEFLRR